MAKKIVNIGLDVGNFDTKTPLSVTNSGFSKFTKIPFGSDEALYLDGSWYVPDAERFPYSRDKTVDDKCFILSLFGIAKEIMTAVSQTCSNVNQVVEKIENVGYVNLGVGLPPAHMMTLNDKLISYYKEHFGEHVEFVYYSRTTNGLGEGRYNFNLKLSNVMVFPQDLTAALAAAKILRKTKDPEFLTIKFKKAGYYAIDIGGYTVDVVPIVEGKPQVANCLSLELGVLRLYGEIAKIINQEFGITLTNEIIENVLQGTPTVIKEDVISRINDITTEWVTRIINEIRKMGLEFNAVPVLFLGGGSALLKTYINKNVIISGCEHSFLTNPKANAIGYKEYLKKIISSAS